MRKILAISSGGGHWEQLLRLRPAFERYDVVYASVYVERPKPIGDAPYFVVPDGNRTTVIKLAWVFLKVCGLLLRTMPDIVVTTGAAPGFLAIFLARIFGARTVWLDSIANANELSLSGRKAKRWTNLWLTQWPHLASPDGPLFQGAVIDNSTIAGAEMSMDLS